MQFLGGNLHLAPLRPPPRRVLDIGTGTGIWALEFAKLYPLSTIVGTDLSTIREFIPTLSPAFDT
jgi:methylase of polypeptide subunit release factors